MQQSVIFLPSYLYFLQDPFDADEFVETLAWRTMGGVRCSVDNFEPMVLHSAFEKTIRELQAMNVTVLEQVEQLEAECIEEEKIHGHRVGELHKHNQVKVGFEVEISVPEKIC